MTFGGSPWEAAKPEHQHYARFKKGWDEWLPNHPDGQIKDEVDGSPKCGPLFKKIDPPALRRLIFKMLHPIPDKRITAHDVVQTNWVKHIECCCPESFEDPKCCVNASSKISSKSASKLVVQKKHNHFPPKEIGKIRQGLTHRFDMGEGWY
jgi:protein-serine/threonine kinase